MLKQAYANDVTVPNLGMNLQIFNEFGTVNFYAPSSLNDPLFTLAVGDDYEVGSSKNSINANDYVMGGGGTVTVMFEVG
jgi:hypothetical protein